MYKQPKNRSVGLYKVKDSNTCEYKSLPESDFDEVLLHAMIGQVRNSRWIESSGELCVLNSKHTKNTVRNAQNTAN
jgi:hypothetical protein